MWRYDDGMMLRVIRNRVSLGDVPPGLAPEDCLVVIDCSLVGRDAWVIWPDGTVTGHTICDCSNGRHRSEHKRRGMACEVSYATAWKHSVDMHLIYPEVPPGRWRLPMDGELPGVSVWLANPRGCLNGTDRVLPCWQ